MISKTQKDLAETLRKALCPHMQERHFDAGHALWTEGDTNGMLVSIKAGHIRISRYTEEGKRVTMYIFGPGTIFGFMPLLDNGPYPATAETISEVDALVMSRQGFKDLVHRDPGLCLTLVAEISARLREALDQIELRSTQGSMSKVAAGLIAQIPPEKAGDPLTILTLPVSFAEFASLLGLTPESFSRAITKLVDSEVLHRLGHNKFQVLDYEALASVGSDLVF